MIERPLLLTTFSVSFELFKMDIRNFRHRTVIMRSLYLKFGIGVAEVHKICNHQHSLKYYCMSGLSLIHENTAID